jgi:hypothetical protein
MFEDTHFNYLFHIKEYPKGFQTQGWRRDVDSAFQAGFNHQNYQTRDMQLLPSRNIGMLRPTNYPYNNRETPEGRATRHVPFRSHEWDHAGTRFFSIPINRTCNHWAGVIVERCGKCKDDGRPTGILHFYDLKTHGRGETKLRQRIMEHIGKSLNLVKTGDTREYLDCYKWRYSDVVTSEYMDENGELQKDDHSCGVIWMMIQWFVVTNKKAPTLQDCLNLWWNDVKHRTNFRMWVAYSILADRIWLPREITDVLTRKLGKNYDAIKAPSYEQWRQNLDYRMAIISKLPVLDDRNASSPTDSTENAGQNS